MPRAGCALGVIAVLLMLGVVDVRPATATMFPTPVRLAMVFGRPDWRAVESPALTLPPGHLVRRWES